MILLLKTIFDHAYYEEFYLNLFLLFKPKPWIKVFLGFYYYTYYTIYYCFFLCFCTDSKEHEMFFLDIFMTK